MEEGQMMQSPQISAEDQPQPQKSPLRIFLLVAIIVIAIGSIIALAYVIINNNSVETSASESVSEVTLTDNGVVPSVVTVKSGDSVTWINESATPYTLEITSADAPQELDGFGGDEPILQGESYSFIFEAAGTFTYDDPNNPEIIQGTVIVEE